MGQLMQDTEQDRTFKNTLEGIIEESRQMREQIEALEAHLLKSDEKNRDFIQNLSDLKKLTKS